jgi:hypothetical protein
MKRQTRKEYLGDYLLKISAISVAGVIFLPMFRGMSAFSDYNFYALLGVAVVTFVLGLSLFSGKKDEAIGGEEEVVE